MAKKKKKKNSKASSIGTGFLKPSAIPRDQWITDNVTVNKQTITPNGDDLRFPSDSDVLGGEYNGSGNQVTYNLESLDSDYFSVRSISFSSLVTTGAVAVIARFKFDIVRGVNVIYRHTHYHKNTNTPQSNTFGVSGIVLLRGDIIRIVIDHDAGTACTYYCSMRVFGNRIN